MYLYFIPKGGLNDILCGLNICLAYSKRHNRVLLFDTTQSCYQINFSDYFKLPQKNIIYDINEIRNICKDNYKIYPTFLNNKLKEIMSGSLEFKFRPDGFTYNNQSIKLPRERREEEIIFYTSCGGGEGFRMFKKLIFKQNIIQYCKDNYNQIQKPYLCIQVRNTDIKCQYKKMYESQKALINNYKSIYVATDDEAALVFFKSKGLNIINFTTFGLVKSRNLHVNSSINPDKKIMDLLSDIYIITMSDKFLSNSVGGFIDLVRDCRRNRDFISRKFITTLPASIEKKSVTEPINIGNTILDFTKGFRKIV